MPEREEHKVPAQDVPVRGDDIRLGQFIKLANLVDSGGAAKEAVAAGRVTVNGEADTRRGRHLRSGDEVVVLDEDATPVAAARVVTESDGGYGGDGASDDDDFFDEATADDDFDPDKWRNL
ncbi:RNA-binding S4 domain-containing protein [Corynebacterium sp.]|uniref:RNA-binding S4 domain-containing protein n=1 Tax=Corynebacterium sp. TaxID=1720 RepID=UPI0028AD52B4|nr:RNA-binding S4 domain-containing protein [Corynebacterium sp.]